MSKKTLYILVIIILIIAGIFVANKITEDDKAKQVVANTLEQTNKTNKENFVEENIVVENNNVEPEENEVTNDASNTEFAPEEKAKQIVKENWGEDDTVYYSYDGKDANGRYVICVREKSTTKALYRYYVDIQTGAFEIE